MMLSTGIDEPLLHITLDKMGMGEAIKRGRSVLIKVNLAWVPEPGHPRTDPVLLTKIIRYAAQCGARCAVAEGAGGYLRQNVETIGLGQTVAEYQVELLDLDLEDFDCVKVESEEHYLPRCLKNYAVRIGIPATSKRPGMLFSNNVKLFVGAVPRHMYQTGEPTTWRPRVHDNLHQSVASIYRAMMAYAPFGFFVNGGAAMLEGYGERDLGEILVGDDAVELDHYVVERFGLELPEYLARL
jgi:uncharacterized protein (DUF362 family)